MGTTVTTRMIVSLVVFVGYSNTDVLGVLS